MLSRRFLDNLKSDRNIGSHNNKSPEFLGSDVNSRELLYFFLSTRWYLKESKHYPAWAAVETRENSAASALWVEDLDQQESKLCCRARHTRHVHRPSLLLCHRHFCLDVAPAAAWLSLTMNGARHDDVASKGTEQLLLTMTFSSRKPRSCPQLHGDGIFFSDY